jgi:hypothetical protein
MYHDASALHDTKETENVTADVVVIYLLVMIVTRSAKKSADSKGFSMTELNFTIKDDRAYLHQSTLIMFDCL